MDLQTLCIVVILAGVLTMLVRAIMAAGQKRSQPAKRSTKRPPPGAFALDDALDKVNETIRILGESMGEHAPSRRDPDGARFYIAYLTGIAREVAKMNRVAYGPALETPIRMELIRLGMDGNNSNESMARLLATDEGQQGLVAGEMDGAEACNPNYRGEYFSRIRSYFTDTRVRGSR